jgi:RNA polymerase sigma factor (sigma-70 family)
MLAEKRPVPRGCDGLCAMRTEVSDAELLAQWGQGSREAGNVLIERYFALVHRFFHSKVGPELDDLIQQTFLGAIEARARYEQRSSFVTFLLGIARHQLYTHYSRRKRRGCHLAVSSMRDLGTSPSGAVARGEDQQLLAAALQAVPLHAQVLLELVYWEGLTAPEAAEVLEIPINTVYSRLARARDALRAQLERLAPDRLECERALRAFHGATGRRGQTGARRA